MTDLRVPAPARSYHQKTTLLNIQSVPVQLVDEGACSGQAGDWDALIEKDIRLAVLVCRACPVQKECLAYARSNREPCGVWGGVKFPEGSL